MSIPIPERTNINIVGSWNRAILNPDWLRKQLPNILKVDEFELEYNPYPAQLIRLTNEGIVILPRIGNLLLYHKEINEQTIDIICRLALGVFEKLPHTPISALGHNFGYDLEPGEKPAIVEFIRNQNQEQFYSELGFPSILTQTITHQFSHEDYKLHVKITLDNREPKVDLNFHYETNTAPSIKDALKQYPDNFRNSLKLLEGLATSE